MEECCRGDSLGSYASRWEDEERKYRLERCINGAKSFLLSSIIGLELMRFFMCDGGG